MMAGDSAKARELLNATLAEAKKGATADLVAVESLEAKLKLLPQ